ncbi:hypothetical protein [Mycolicibacterium thermoresistibile]
MSTAAHEHLHAAAGVTEKVTQGIVAVLMFVVIALGFLWFRQFAVKRASIAQAPLMAESGAFCARWPADRLWSAPYMELAAEEVRCRQIIQILKSRNHSYRRGLFGYGDPMIFSQISGFERWLVTVQSAMGHAARREQWPPPPQP